MRKTLVILLIALSTGVISYLAMRSQKPEHRHPEILLDTLPELAWLKKDLKLSDSQFEKVKALHVDYRPKCEEMCHRVAAAHERLDEASRAAGGMTPELRNEIANHARIHAECQEAMLTHLYQTAAVLEKDQARRYLHTMLPFAMDFSHSENGGSHER